MEFEPVIGLEVHAELNTKSKMYCTCANEFGGVPNSRVCPVCVGMPGAMPSLNRAAVKKAILVGKMMNCTIAKITRQYRKHYRYPDLPKGYQISQFTVPLCMNGTFDFFDGDTLQTAKIRQIHIEEDAGKLIHEGDSTFVDYNRCGVPLIEIVTEPCFHSADAAVAFMEAVRTMLLDLGVSDCRMQEGSLRADVNISLRKAGESALAPRVEMKNLGTFSGARRAIEYEIARQSEILRSGGTVSQLTRKWDDERGIGITMRDKENAQDYRFMPEPDIPAIVVSDISVTLPESETKRRIRLQNVLKPAQAKEIARDREICGYFDSTVLCGADAKATANWMLGHLAKLANEHETAIFQSQLSPKRFFEVMQAIDDNKITADGAKRAFDTLFLQDEPIDDVIRRLGLAVLSDDSIYREIVSAVVCENPKAVSDYKTGKTSVLGFFTGQCMRRAGAGADAALFKKLLEEELGR